MTSKKLLISWFVLAAMAALGVVTGDALLKDVPGTVAQEVLYQPVPDSTAVALALGSCKENSDQQLALAQAGSSCESFFTAGSAGAVELAQKFHKNGFESEQVWPRIQEQKERLKKNLMLFNVGLAIAAFLVFAMWFKSTIYAYLGRLNARLRERMLLSQDLKVMGANRKVRQAESDFLTLKNLHENGLISDEMFSKRKEELKVALTTNDLFKA